MIVRLDCLSKDDAQQTGSAASLCHERSEIPRDNLFWGLESLLNLVTRDAEPSLPGLLALFGVLVQVMGTGLCLRITGAHYRAQRLWAVL